MRISFLFSHIKIKLNSHFGKTKITNHLNINILIVFIQII